MRQVECGCQCEAVKPVTVSEATFVTPDAMSQTVAWAPMEVDTPEPIFSPAFGLILVLVTVALALRNQRRRTRSLLALDERKASSARTMSSFGWRIRLSPVERKILALVSEAGRSLFRPLAALDLPPHRALKVQVVARRDRRISRAG